MNLVYKYSRINCSIKKIQINDYIRVVEVFDTEKNKLLTNEICRVTNINTCWYYSVKDKACQFDTEICYNEGMTIQVMSKNIGRSTCCSVKVVKEESHESS